MPGSSVIFKAELTPSLKMKSAATNKITFRALTCPGILTRADSWIYSRVLVLPSRLRETSKETLWPCSWFSILHELIGWGGRGRNFQLTSPPRTQTEVGAGNCQNQVPALPNPDYRAWLDPPSGEVIARPISQIGVHGPFIKHNSVQELLSPHSCQEQRKALTLYLHDLLGSNNCLVQCCAMCPVSLQTVAAQHSGSVG